MVFDLSRNRTFCNDKLQMMWFPEHLKYLPAYVFGVIRLVYMQLKSKNIPTHEQFYV